MSNADKASPMSRHRGALSRRLAYGLVVILLLGMAATVVWFGSQQWLDYRASITDRQLDLERHNIVGSQQRAKLHSVLDTQRDNLLQMDQRVSDLGLRVNAHALQLAELGNTSRTGWLLAEAAYLVRLANQRLYTERSAANPLALLNSIDDIFLELDNPKFLPVRTALAADIAALVLVGEIDVDGLYIQLDTLGRQLQTIDAWPHLEERQAAPYLDSVGQADSQAVGALAVWQALVERFSELFRVQRRQLPVSPLLDEMEQRQLKDTLKRLVGQAQAALLFQRSNIYRLSLNEAHAVVRDYFPKHPDTELLAQQLDQLAKRQIIQQLPTITDSLHAIDTALALERERERLDGTGPSNPSESLE